MDRGVGVTETRHLWDARYSLFIVPDLTDFPSTRLAILPPNWR